jgi:hypothetical protein
MRLTDVDYVKGLQSNLRATFEGEAGKAVMEFLEESCGWYQSIFDPQNRDICLINDGKRQVVATIKTLLRYKPEEIVSMAKQKEGV